VCASHHIVAAQNFYVERSIGQLRIFGITIGEDVTAVKSRFKVIKFSLEYKSYHLTSDSEALATLRAALVIPPGTKTVRTDDKRYHRLIPLDAPIYVKYDDNGKIIKIQVFFKAPAGAETSTELFKTYQELLGKPDQATENKEYISHTWNVREWRIHISRRHDTPSYEANIWKN